MHNFIPKYGSWTKLTHTMPCPTRFLTWVKFLHIFSTKWGQSNLEDKSYFDLIIQ